MKQNDVHKVIILYLYIRGRNDYGDETTRGAKRLVGAKRLGGKRLGGKRLGGVTTRGRNGLGAKRPGFVRITPLIGTTVVRIASADHHLRCWVGAKF